MTTDDLADQITALLTGWGLSRERVVSRREAQTMASALVKLWPDTPPTPIDPAEIKFGMRVRRVWERDGATLTVEGIVSDADSERVYFNGYCHSYLAEGGDWFLVADAPDDDARWIRAIAEATPETAPTVYAAIKGEQA